MSGEELRFGDLAELLQPVEKRTGVRREREVLALLFFQMLDLSLLLVHLLAQWLDDRIGEDVARLCGDVGGVLAAAGDGADDRADPAAAVQNSALEKNSSGISRPPRQSAMS